jgi:hypothetical protein
MGGLPPFGYDVPTNGTRVLRVNEAEAATVRHIFERYLELRSVHRLVNELKQAGVRSKARVNRRGESTGAQPFGRGAIFHLLKNPIYVGQIVHKGDVHDGQHEAIIDQVTFDRVQAVIARDRRDRCKRRTTSSPLIGKLFDAYGNRLTPTHSRNRHGRTYRYYVASKLQHGGAGGPELRRFPAPRVDALIGAALRRTSTIGEPNFDVIVRATLSAHSIELALPARLLTAVRQKLATREHVSVHEENFELIRWTIPAVLRRGESSKVQPADSDVPARDPVLINALRRAHKLMKRDASGLPLIETLPQSRYEFRLMRLALLSPRIQCDILAGRQPPGLRLEDLVRAQIPLCWKTQGQLILRLSSAT